MTNIQYYTKEQVAEHHDTKSLWVIHQDRVYDITHFMESHPGGEEILLQFGGKDITQAMEDPLEHVHSASAMEILEEYCIGHLKGAAKIESLKEKKQFIDPSKPMLYQLFTKGFSKKFYLEQVHIPRHVPYSAPLFGPVYLEVFSKTPWYGVPIFWAPIITYCMVEALGRVSLWPIVYSFVLGLFIWTLIEYSLHRFVFHMDKWLPDHPIALSVHFVMHGIHHFLPMDGLRLVMPPALGFTLAYPFWCLFVYAFPLGIGHAVSAGAMSGFVAYDMMHYYNHHGKPTSKYMKMIKTYHLDHHYKEPNLGFGVSNTFWDHVFNTVLV